MQYTVYVAYLFADSLLYLQTTYCLPYMLPTIYAFNRSEVSALLDRMPSADGYQPSLSTKMGMLQERITSTEEGSIISIQVVYVPTDDSTDPTPATTFAHLDATIVLLRGLAVKGIYLAVDPLDSPPYYRSKTL
ncbi:uncharacterized protein LOC111404773 [Olea europaea var. sylvestris]|uniref:uncharacterized protein LOC111404773 n=1 Tax=Olea europaea var. sylvestris TaxID=158386 RepID=UPI000C1CF8D2|nr:uncharacterized protein LOC111404773 [Olea europaea var. sylvestris]